MCELAWFAVCFNSCLCNATSIAFSFFLTQNQMFKLVVLVHFLHALLNYTYNRTC